MGVPSGTNPQLAVPRTSNYPSGRSNDVGSVGTHERAGVKGGLVAGPIGKGDMDLIGDVGIEGNG